MSTIRYCDFFYSKNEGAPMNEGEVPEMWGEFNVAWPRGWTQAQAQEYRRQHGWLSEPSVHGQ
jgi:hypothetical protein